MENLNKACYIQSIEASAIYTHVHRGTKLKGEYVGSIPFSLELLKLKEEGIKVKPMSKTSQREITDDIINVKFRQKVSSGNEMIAKILPEKIQDVKNKIEDKEAKLEKEENKEKVNQKKVDKLKSSIEKSNAYIVKLEAQIETIKVEMKDENVRGKWDSVSNTKLREELYTKGFTICTVNEKTGEIKEVEYVGYKRTSSKSRKGERLFIRNSLYKKMIKWSRMGLTAFKEDIDIDLASLTAYESLVSSTLESLITIPTKNILIVDDIESEFTEWCNVVRKGEDGFLDSFYEQAKIRNSLFDGSSLLDSSYFEENQSMQLLRQHFFKSASFSVDLQKYYMDQAKELGKDYDTWEVENMFGESMKVKDIHMVITPNSLKALKFSHLMKTKKNQEQQMWNYWKELIAKEGNEEGAIFGVCKHEKGSKLEGKLQQTSYQMINSLPMEKEDVSKLAKTDLDYIEGLKNDDAFFISHIERGANEQNSYEMLVETYGITNDFINSKVFRDFRKAEINRYVNHVKKGKLKLEADYVVLLGNPMLYLQHSIGQLNVVNGILDNETELELTGKQVYTTLHEFGEELVSFRNPHSSPSNVLVSENTYVKDIETYFNLTDNIVCVNACEFNIMNKLNGCDYDSDSILTVLNGDLLRLAKDCQKYPVDINGITPEKARYKLNTRDMYIIDNILSESQKFIGKTVNTGQFALSCYWDQIANGISEDDLKELMKKISVATILSGIAIDMAKKLYELEPMKEIRNIEAYAKQYIRRVEYTYINKKGKVKKSTRQRLPQFWVVLNDSDTIKDRVTSYDCPMDYLFNEFTGLDRAIQKSNIDFISLLDSYNIKKADHKQEYKILDCVETMCEELNGIYASKNSKKEKEALVTNAIKFHQAKVAKLTVSKETMYATLRHMIQNKYTYSLRLMNVLYETQKETYLSVFKRNK